MVCQFMCAVCVVCLLCADGLHCQEHVSNTTTSTTDSSMQDVTNQLSNSIHITENHLPSKSKSSYTIAADERTFQRHRNRRHANHEKEDHTQPKITEYFVQRLFTMYGGEDGKINSSSFQNMLSHFGLHNFIKQEFVGDESHNSGNTDSNSCISDRTMVNIVQQNRIVNSTYNCSNSERCSPKLLNEKSGDYLLETQDVVNLCPVLLYQMASQSVLERSGCINESTVKSIEHLEADTMNIDKKNDNLYVWVYATISITVCSILGLVGIAIIPFMYSRFYKHIIQFLVALAVGTMTGDALLHLLPHSLADQNERNMIFKGLTCMGGIIFFYVTEHGFTMISEWRKSIAKKESKKPPFAKVVRDQDSRMNDSVAGDKLCKSKYSSYPYCYDEIAISSNNDMWLHVPNRGTEEHTTTNGEKKRSEKSEEDSSEIYAEEALLSKKYCVYREPNKIANPLTSKDIDPNSMGDGNNLTVAERNASDYAIEQNKKIIERMENEAVTVILREHESSHHGHSHKHGHVHSPPESLSAVAWMIIMGDGLHNFTDGMAIGAAFAENLAGGFSTSLAVFCHELPHELGDFAILMTAGMTVKSAVFYNLLTGVLSFVGMIFGIVFGQSRDTAQWMFAAASGLFIYIALVDMMPELTSTHKSFQQLALQILGMSTGVMLMLLLAVYEGDLMNVFSSPRSASTGLGHGQHGH